MKNILLLISILVLISCTSGQTDIDVDKSNNFVNIPSTPDKSVNSDNLKDASIEKPNNVISENTIPDKQNSSTNTSSDSDPYTTLPDISYFATNKSDRFFVDFENIVAAHPYVGANSPRPHNDAQVYFSNTDERWVNATQPSDYPPIYAVSDLSLIHI